MASGYEFNYFLVCDDVRQEVTGKEILIGVYQDAILVPTFPAMLFSLWFRISVRLTRIGFKLVHFAIKNPDGSDMISTSAPVLYQSAKEPTVFNVPTRGIVFPRAGVYSVWFGLDEPAKQIGSLVLRMPATDQEQQRIIH